MGFLAMDVVDPPEGAVWGRWNDRVVKQDFVDGLAKQFELHVENCVEEFAIDVAVRPSWLDQSVKMASHVDGEVIQDVPTIMLSAAGVEAIRGGELLWVLGGNHRRLALMKCIANMREELVKNAERVADVKEGKFKFKGEGDKEAEKAKMLKKLDTRAAFLERRLDSVSTEWVIRLYNRGAFLHIPRTRGV